MRFEMLLLKNIKLYLKSICNLVLLKKKTQYMLSAGVGFKNPSKSAINLSL
jgi:hypothetical protein